MYGFHFVTVENKSLVCHYFKVIGLILQVHFCACISHFPESSY